MSCRPFPATARTRTGVVPASAAALLSAGALLPAPAVAAAPVTSPRATAAVLDLDADRTPVVRGADSAYDTASIVKVDILAALLLRAQDAGRQLTAEERGHAEPMIKRSDNTAADALWRKIGRASGLATANKRLGLSSTTGGSAGQWGLTRTTASDQIRLLRAVFEGDTTTQPGTPSTPLGATALNARSRAYVRSLMGQVVPEQTWGVSAADASGSSPALKNGWLQRTTSGLWDVNSVGQVTVKGHRYLVAVLSNGSASMSDGISLVERTARQAVA
ncbi:serine hydrolase [Streptomyces sp. NPDC002521]